MGKYQDLSFMLQSFDNTTTHIQVDPEVAARREWGRDLGEARESLVRQVADLHVREKPTESGQGTERITIYRDGGSFSAQFYVDNRDDAGRPANVLCFGWLPRAHRDGADERGRRLLRDFLRRYGIQWTEGIERRFAYVCREIAERPASGPGLLSRLFTLPEPREQPTTVLRRRPPPSPAPPPPAPRQAPREAPPEAPAEPVVQERTEPEAVDVAERPAVDAAEPHLVDVAEPPAVEQEPAPASAESEVEAAPETPTASATQSEREVSADE